MALIGLRKLAGATYSGWVMRPLMGSDISRDVSVIGEVLKAIVAGFVIAALSSIPALADENEELAVCDQSISARQPVPALYERRAYSRSSHRLSRLEFAAILEKHKVPSDKVAAQLAKFDTGSLTPTDVTYVIDYLATTSEAVLVTKRSTCVIRINRPEDPLIMEIAVVDGINLWEFEALRAKQKRQ